MQAVFALAFLALANAAIIDPYYYKPEAKIYNPFERYTVEDDYRYGGEYPEKYLSDAAISAPVADAVIASLSPAGAPVSYARTASPWASIISGASPVVSSAIPLDAAYAPALKSGLAHAIPAVKSAAYHLVKADYPYFTAAPTSSYVESAAPVVSAEEIAARALISSALASAFPATAASLAAADPALRAYAPAGLVSAASPATHYFAAPAASASAPLFKSAAAGAPWGLISSFAAPASAVSAASAPISLVKAASPLLGAESAFAPAAAFAPAPAVHAIHAAPAFAAAPPAGLSYLVASPSGVIPSSAGPIHLVKSTPASFATGLFGAESALTGFAPAGTPVTLVKAISPASGLSGVETAIAYAPAHAGHAHAFYPTLKAAFPATAASLAGAALSADALTYARAVPTLSVADAAALSAFAPAGLTAYAVPAAARYATLAESPALKAWIK